jgi:23S rRNA (cytosine1962-C5)-methyltransferase
LALNGLAAPHHAWVRADVLAYLETAHAQGAQFDLVVLDPPSFSRSKAMRRTFEIQRDHPALLTRTYGLLAPRGVLYFSTNLRGFRPHFPLGMEASELTPGSLPRDFQQRDAHRCWRFQRK